MSRIAAPDRAEIDPAAVRSYLACPDRWQITHVTVTGSTNADLAVVARSGVGMATDGEVPLRQGGVLGEALLADEQTSGRGRLGRSWHAPRGGSTMMSVLLWPGKVPPAGRGWVGGLLGLAVVAAIERTAGLTATLKWPNDVLIDGRKCAGILAEAGGSAVVVGVGINVNMTADELATASRDNGTPGTSLMLAADRDPAPGDRERLTAAVLDEFAVLLDRWYAAHGDFDAAGLLELYRAKSATVGSAVRVQTSGTSSVLGIATGVAADGALLVRDAAGMDHRFLAADVVHVRPPADAAVLTDG